MASIGLRQHARGLMNELADETGGDVSMGIRDRLSVVLIETSRSRDRARAWPARSPTSGCHCHSPAQPLGAPGSVAATPTRARRSSTKSA